MRCALDATPLIGAGTGVAAFVDGLLRGLAERPDVEAFGYALSWRGRSMLREVLPAGVTSGWSVPAGPMLRLWARSSLVPIELIMDIDDGIDVVHGTNFVVPPARRAARVVTVHDLTSVRFPEMCAPTSRRYPALARRAISEGAWVHTPSTFVADEVCDVLGADPARVRAVPHGVVPVAGDPAAGRKLGVQLTGCPRYVLALGTIEPRKDYPTLVKAWDLVAGDHPDTGLVIAGGDGWGIEAFNAAVSASRFAGRIGRAGYVAEEMRADLLSGAAVLAYPSRYEGFGLPPLEAMAAGVPVVATRTGAIPEVCGNAAWLVDIGSAPALADALTTVLASGGADLVERGHARVDGFTWDRAVDQMVGLYRDARG